MATGADRAFLDTNVLLAATDEDRADHRAATRVLNDSPALGVTLYLSGQILREYLVVASRPMDGNGLGLPMSSALANVDAFLGRTTVVEETLAIGTLRRDGSAACPGVVRFPADNDRYVNLRAGGLSLGMSSPSCVGPPRPDGPDLAVHGPRRRQRSAAR